MRLITWKTIFLSKRDLSAPDGRPLYAYRTTNSEFTSLESLLRDSIAEHRHPMPLSHAFEFVPAFSTLYVLYAAEWWRQRYDGSGFSWEPILAGLNAPTDGWTPHQRSVCVTKGLEHWRLKPMQGSGMRFIGSIALQGGLPLQLLARAQGDLGRLLRCVLKEAVKSSATSLDILNWVRSLNHYLPNTYRQPEIDVLLTDVIVTALCLKDEAGLTQPTGAIAELDRQIPGWRDRFPLPMEDHLAQGLLEQLIQDVATARVERQPRNFCVERFLEKAGNETWQLCSSISLPESVQTKSLSSMFALDGAILPRFLELTLEALEARRMTSLRRLAGQDKFRLERKPWRLASLDASSEHILRLSAADGRVWSVATPRGEALDDELAWVFDARDESPKLLRQGSGAVSTNEALVAVPHGYLPQAAGLGEVAHAGKLEALQRNVFLVRVEGRFECRGVVCRIRTGRADAREENYEWRGQRLWHTVVYPSMAFIGKPRCYKVDENGIDHVVNGEPDWRPMGAERRTLDKPLGPVELWHTASGEVRHRARMVILPFNAHMRLECDDAVSGRVHLENWGVTNMGIDQIGVTATVEQQGLDLVLSVKAAANTRPPETVEAFVYWPHTPQPARLSLPFPAKGVRFFGADGREIPDGSRLAANHLMGMRALCLMGIPGAPSNMRLELCVPQTGSSVSFQIRPPDDSGHAEIRLQDYAPEISQLLSYTDSPDAHIEVVFRSTGRVLARLRVARYACRVQRLEKMAALDQETTLALSPEELCSLPVMAIRLNAPNEDPIRLAPLTSEGIPTGAWAFDPDTLESGPWLIYPAVGSSVAFRPTLWSIPGVLRHGGRLAQAVSVDDPEEREALLDAAICCLAKDFGDSDWQDVERLAEQLGHLPLVTLDLWRRFARSGKAMASLALHIPSLPFSFLTRFASELPFVWELISLKDWVEAMSGLKKQCEVAFGASSEAFLRIQLDGRLCELTAHHPALTYLLQVARVLFTGERPQELRAFKMLGQAGMKRLLFEGDDCQLQLLLRRHSEEKWPESFNSDVARARNNPKPGMLLHPEGQGFHDSVINMPTLLAHRAVADATKEWLMNSDLVLELRRHIVFDPDWFEEALNWGAASCCVAAGLLDEEAGR